jgi:hypothetical protein
MGTTFLAVIISISKRNKLAFNDMYSLHNRAGWCKGKTLDLYSGGIWSIRISAETPSILTEVFRSLPPSFQANAGIVPPFCHDCFLPNHFQFIIHQPLYKLTLYSLDTDAVLNKPLKNTKSTKSRKMKGMCMECARGTWETLNGRDTRRLCLKAPRAVREWDLEPRITVLARASCNYWTERNTWKTKGIYGGSTGSSIYDAWKASWPRLVWGNFRQAYGGTTII